MQCWRPLHCQPSLLCISGKSNIAGPSQCCTVLVAWQCEVVKQHVYLLSALLWVHSQHSKWPVRHSETKRWCNIVPLPTK